MVSAEWAQAEYQSFRTRPRRIRWWWGSWVNRADRCSRRNTRYSQPDPSGNKPQEEADVRIQARGGLDTASGPWGAEPGRNG